MKQEHKILKQEIEMMPAKSDRKEIYRRRKEMLDIEQNERVNLIGVHAFFADLKKFVF